MHDNMVCLLNSCLYVMFRSCFESLASVVPIKLVRAVHCGAPRIAAHRTYMGSCRKKMTGSFQILDAGASHDSPGNGFIPWMAVVGLITDKLWSVSAGIDR